MKELLSQAKKVARLFGGSEELLNIIKSLKLTNRRLQGMERTIMMLSEQFKAHELALIKSMAEGRTPMTKKELMNGGWVLWSCFAKDHEAFTKMGVPVHSESWGDSSAYGYTGSRWDGEDIMRINRYEKTSTESVIYREDDNFYWRGW